MTGQIHYAWLDDVWLERRQGFLFHVWGVAFGKSTVCQRAHAEPPIPLPPCVRAVGGTQHSLTTYVQASFLDTRQMHIPSAPKTSPWQVITR